MWLLIGWRNRRKQKRPNKTWLWARARLELRERTPPRRRRPGWSPSWRHSPPSATRPHAHNHTRKREANTTGYSGRRTNHLLSRIPKFSDAGSLAITYFIKFKLYLTKYVRLWRLIYTGCTMNSCQCFCTENFVPLFNLTESTSTVWTYHREGLSYDQHSACYHH